MMMRTVLAILSLLSCVAALAGGYSLQHDFSDVENPHREWEFREAPQTTFTSHVADFWGDNSMQGAWAEVRFPLEDHAPFWLKATAASAGSRIPDALVGEIYFHGGEDDRTGSHFTSVRWRSPNSCVARVHGALWMPVQNGRTMDWELRRNGTVVSAGSLTGNGTYTHASKYGLEAGTGGLLALAQPVNTNDVLELAFLSHDPNLGELLGLDLYIETSPCLVRPDHLFVDEGTFFSGAQSACDASDDIDFRIFSDPDSLVTTIGIAGSVPILQPESLNFTFEGSTARSSLAYEIRLFDYDASEYEVVLGEEAPLADTTSTILMSDPGRFVSESGQLRTQVSWFPFNDEVPSQDGWLCDSDYASWLIS